MPAYVGDAFGSAQLVKDIKISVAGQAQNVNVGFVGDAFGTAQKFWERTAPDRWANFRGLVSGLVDTGGSNYSQCGLFAAQGKIWLWSNTGKLSVFTPGQMWVTYPSTNSPLRSLANTPYIQNLCAIGYNEDSQLFVLIYWVAVAVTPNIRRLQVYTTPDLVNVLPTFTGIYGPEVSGSQGYYQSCYGVRYLNGVMAFTMSANTNSPNNIYGAQQLNYIADWTPGQNLKQAPLPGWAGTSYSQYQAALLVMGNDLVMPWIGLQNAPNQQIALQRVNTITKLATLQNFVTTDPGEDGYPIGNGTPTRTYILSYFKGRWYKSSWLSGNQGFIGYSSTPVGPWTGIPILNDAIWNHTTSSPICLFTQCSNDPDLMFTYAFSMPSASYENALQFYTRDGINFYPIDGSANQQTAPIPEGNGGFSILSEGSVTMMSAQSVRIEDNLVIHSQSYSSGVCVAGPNTLDQYTNGSWPVVTSNPIGGTAI